MENNVDFATIGASAPDTYANTILQGSSDLDYQPISPRPTPPASSAAASNDAEEQAARLRALLSSHLSESATGSSQAAGEDRLEALIDMLYDMTAPAEAAPAATPREQTPAPEARQTHAPAAELAQDEAPVGESAHLQMPVEEPHQPSAPAHVEMPDAPMSAVAPVVSEEASPSPAPAEAYAFAPPEPVAETPTFQPVTVEATPEAIPEATSVFVSAPAETPVAQTPTFADADAHHEEGPVTEARAPQEPTVSSEEPPTPFTNEAHHAPSTAAASSSHEAEAPPPAPAVEILTMENTDTLLDPLMGESAANAGAIVFNLVTSKSTASLQIPMQPNLSLITFEQRLDEIILKIHLSL